MDPVDVADDGSVGHGGVAAVVVVGAAEGLRLLHVDVAHVVVQRGDLGGGVRAAVAFELLLWRRRGRWCGGRPSLKQTIVLYIY